MFLARLPLGAAVAVTAALAASTAYAHVGLHTESFTTDSFWGGLTHPFGGLDHLLAMVAVGLWAMQQGGRALYAVPAAFVASMGLGFVLGLGGIGLPFVEAGIVLSVLALGLAVALAVKPPLTLALPVTAAFALCHGVAHGAEMPAASPVLLYAAGMLLGTALLHGLGLLAARQAQRRALPLLTRAAGAAMALAGLVLLVV